MKKPYTNPNRTAVLIVSKDGFHRIKRALGKNAVYTKFSDKFLERPTAVVIASNLKDTTIGSISSVEYLVERKFNVIEFTKFDESVK